MRRLIRLIILLGLPMVLGGAEADWQVLEAEFRLIARSDRPAGNTYLSLGDFAMPILLGQGIDVRDRNGKKIPFYLHQTLGLVLGSAPDSPERYIYFGLPRTSPVDQWDKKLGSIPSDRTIYANVYNHGHRYRTTQEWLDNQIGALENRFRSYNNWMFQYLCQSIALGALTSGHLFLRQEVRDPLAEPVREADWDKPLDREDYKCWRYSDRVRRVNFFSDREMKNSYSDPYRFSQARVDWAWRRLYLSRKSLFNAVPRLKERAPEAPMKEFINIFKEPYRRPIFTGNMDLFYIAADAFDSRRNMAAVLEGNLIVPEDGEYEFCVESAGSFLLYFGEDLKLRKYNEPELRKYLKINLKTGIQDLKLCFQRPSFSSVALSWKKPGAKSFTILGKDDFAPAWPCRVIAMQEKGRGDIPLIREISLYDIFTGKREKRLWREMAAVPRPDEKPPQITWLINGVPAFIGERATLITASDDLFGVMTEQYPPTRFFWLRQNRDHKPWLHADIELKLHLPDFIYDDEELEMFVELASGLPTEARSILSVSPDRPNSLFAENSREVTIPPRRRIQEDRYAADGIYKYPVLLKGAELKDGLNVQFTVKVPQLTFAARTLRFVSVESLPSLTLDESGRFRDEAGAVVVPVLHRPTLNELRSWELPARIRNRLMPTRHMLLIADDSGGLGDKVEQVMKEKKVALTFLAWGDDGIALNRMRQDLPALADVIPGSNADVAVVIPAVADLNGNIPVRSQVRHLAALLQLLRANRSIHTIYLSTPFPVEGREAEEKQLSEELRRLARDFGVEVINLNYILRHQDKMPSNEEAVATVCKIVRETLH